TQNAPTCCSTTCYGGASSTCSLAHTNSTVTPGHSLALLFLCQTTTLAFANMKRMSSITLLHDRNETADTVHPHNHDGQRCGDWTPEMSQSAKGQTAAVGVTGNHEPALANVDAFRGRAAVRIDTLAATRGGSADDPAIVFDRPQA